ncbi:MAG: 3-deoxy-manno-octulosonate cytidylyltransferase, partial [Betaproteobacteria bacterium]|nr:3-deoxy-manno-octulosonate cytidylyltransferase [Betaproteobacteria bacterium]
MSFTVLIPARLASTRLPNKPLVDIGGLPMVVRVARRVLSGNPGSWQPRVVVAADSTEITEVCAAHGVESVLTRTDHPSGSDRLAEASALLGLSDDEIVVNVQGDEPLIDPALVSAVANLLVRQPQASMSTAAHPIDNEAEYNNPNVVKVVLDASAMALYFSRAPIPHWRDQPAGSARFDSPSALNQSLHHIGIYAYRSGFLRQFPNLPQA